jgi:hypothetical protein
MDHSTENLDNHHMVLSTGQLMRDTMAVSADLRRLQSMQLKNNSFSAQVGLTESEVERVSASTNTTVMNSSAVIASANSGFMSPVNQTQRDAAKLSQLYAAQQGGQGIVLYTRTLTKIRNGKWALLYHLLLRQKV